jgi:hypothetical protein
MKYYDYPVQVKFYDIMEGGLSQGVAYQNEIISLEHGGVFDIEEIIKYRPENLSPEQCIIEYDRWWHLEIDTLETYYMYKDNVSGKVYRDYDSCFEHYHSELSPLSKNFQQYLIEAWNKSEEYIQKMTDFEKATLFNSYVCDTILMDIENGLIEVIPINRR